MKQLSQEDYIRRGLINVEGIAKYWSFNNTINSKLEVFTKNSVLYNSYIHLVFHVYLISDSSKIIFFFSSLGD